MQTLLRDTPLIVSSRTIAVGPADSGQMIALRLGDRLVIDVPSAPGVSWRVTYPLARSRSALRLSNRYSRTEPLDVARARR